MYTIETEDFFQSKDICGMTLVLLDDDDNVVHKVNGVSRRTPGDKPDLDLGFDLAAGRALAALSRKFLKPAEGKIKNMEHNQNLKKENGDKLMHLLDAKKDDCPACSSGKYGIEGPWTDGALVAPSYSELIALRRKKGLEG